ncbi:hypothetical protein [Roseiconus lacunae]|uniref:hypothetical protein n=1 Tax=Roseiconus lacunae TaxID=2605694 RepID=UPI0011F258D2|nr:hypothetical protein [Roseiconus lacunae]
MDWKSYSHIVDELALDVSPNDPSAVADAVRAKRIAAHPDKTGGEFTDDEHKQTYTKLNSANEWIERQGSNNALIPIEQLPSLIKTIGELQQPSKEEKIGKLVRDTRSEARHSRQSTYGVPRIGSGALAAIAAFLAAFPEKFAKVFATGVEPTDAGEKARYLAELAQRQQSISILFLTGALVAAMMFCLTWLFERRDEELIESAMSSDARMDLFARLVSRIRERDDDLTFPAVKFVELVREYLGDRGFLPFPYRMFVPSRQARISPAVAEKIALVHLEELESRGAIEKVESRSLYQKFKIDPEAAEEAHNHRMHTERRW